VQGIHRRNGEVAAFDVRTVAAAAGFDVGGGFGLNSKKSITEVSGKEYLRADTLIGAGANILLS